MLNKVLFFVVTLCSLSVKSYSQKENDGLVNWLTLKEAQEKQRT